MIKKDKNLNNIPQSLLPTVEGLNNTRVSRTTHLKRMTIIDGQKYIDVQTFNKRYKLPDIRIALKEIYKNKCAYCEQRVEKYHIEHYRPKHKYYWLAYSWDNLIIACPTCNEFKGDNFELLNNQINFIKTDQVIRNINTCSSNYDDLEKPKMVNPEITDPLNYIAFQRNGSIYSDDVRFAYTIDKCSIDRPHLIDERRRLLDIFTRDIVSILVENKCPEAQQNEVSVIIRKFVRDSKDEELEFLAFRRYAISSNWLNYILKEMKPVYLHSVIVD